MKRLKNNSTKLVSLTIYLIIQIFTTPELIYFPLNNPEFFTSYFLTSILTKVHRKNISILPQQVTPCSKP